MSRKQIPNTRRIIQDRRKDLSKSMLNTTATVLTEKTSQQTTRDIQRTDSDFLPRPLTTPNQNHVYWTHLPSLGGISPSPENEPNPELQHSYQSLLDTSSISEESLSTESSQCLDSGTTSPSPSSTQESRPFQWFSASSDYSSLSLGSSIERSISRDLQSLEDLTSETENEDEDEGRFTFWHDLRPGSSQPSNQPSSLARTSSLFSTPRALPPYDSPYGTYLPNITHRQTPASPSGTSSPLINRGGTSGDHNHLPSLDIRPRRSPPALLDGAGRMETNSLDTASSGLEDRENEEGALGGPAEGQSPGAAAQPSTASFTHNLTLALMALHDLRIEVTQWDGSHHTGHSGNPQRELSCNPETLRRIMER